jgi:uncharacterized protein
LLFVNNFFFMPRFFEISIDFAYNHYLTRQIHGTKPGEGAAMHGKNYHWLLFLLALGAVLLPLQAERPEDVLNPRSTSGTFVSDGGGVLGPEYFRLINEICRELKAKTTIEMTVVTVGDLGGSVIDEFAEKVFRRFAVGVAGKDNGLLVLCARDEYMVRLEVGYGLEATMPDALASRLLDRNAIPQLQARRFGRGLFLATRDVAMAAANASGMAMTIPDPMPWPAEITPPKPLVKQPKKNNKSWDPLRSSLYFALGLLAFAALGLFWTLQRYNKKRGRAARAKVIGSAMVPTILTWIAAVISFFFLLVFGGKFITPFIAMLAAPGLATAGQLLTSRLLKQRLASYRLPCSACGQPMDMVPDSDDEKFLTPEEAAEEKAGGMDYEFWQCPKCNASERLAVKLGKATKCPQCGRRTLTSSSTTLVAATKDQDGRVRVTETCLNPKCNYSKTRESSTPPLSSPSSSSPSSSRSSSASFGGGRSGGGGASKKF